MGTGYLCIQARYHILVPGTTAIVVLISSAFVYSSRNVAGIVCVQIRTKYYLPVDYVCHGDRDDVVMKPLRWRR